MVLEVPVIQPADFQQYYQSNKDKPFKVCNFLKGTSIGQITLENILREVGTREINVKIGKIGLCYVENECLFLQGTLNDIIAWSRGESSCFDELDNDYWIYADYKNFYDIFPKNNGFLEDKIDWGFVNHPEKKAQNTTIWVGTNGSHTPLHYDSYGYNFHVITTGCKYWKLFSPNDTEYLYPTRIPYEESSVYSTVDVLNPDLTRFSMYTKAEEWETYLYPGDVLYIPFHWWHFVQCKETAVSLNIWCEVESDKEERLKESLVRSLIHSWKNYEKQDKNDWLNPNEIVVDFDEAHEYINYSLKAIKENSRSLNSDEILEAIISDDIITAIMKKIIGLN